jgi:RimJ/RimL family protein N-acetyltransferase
MSDGEQGEEPEFRASIETRRLHLRRPLPHDEAEIATLSAGRAIAENLAALPCPVHGEHGETFVVVERNARRLIGAAMYGPMAERRRATEVACWIGESHWGFGYATEASQALIDRAFADDRIDILWCSNRVMNHRARRVIEKCGFQFRETGMVRSPILKGAVPVERFVLERRNWAALRAWGLPSAARERNGESHDTAA